MVRLNNIPKNYGIKCEMLAKCEFFNPGGSVKDRIAYRMIQDAEEKGLLKPGFTIIEPTSGNTGIGLALASAVKGYKCIIVMPEKMSNEKLYTLQALGAKIVRTPTEAAWDSPESHISVSQKLQKEIPNSIILDQYTNSGNPLAHYDHTAMEIWKQCEGKVDYVIVGAGTGGTITGIGRKLKELSPGVKIIGVDPEGSILAHPEDYNMTEAVFYEVEGIGYDFMPTVLSHGVIDSWIKSNDNESLNAARMLINQEGLLCGGSSGAALSVAVKLAKDLPADKRVVVLLPDGLRNYMTKFVSDTWMEVRGFLEKEEHTKKWWWNILITELTFHEPQIFSKTASCQEALNTLQNKPLTPLIITDDHNKVKGTITLNNLTHKLIFGTLKPDENAEKAIDKQFLKVHNDAHLGILSLILEKEHFAVVLNEDGVAVGTINQQDVYNFINNANNFSKHAASNGAV
ncbi:cystathionine beta-synthase isoform X2 [Prorops nasuta]